MPGFASDHVSQRATPTELPLRPLWRWNHAGARDVFGGSTDSTATKPVVRRLLLLVLLTVLPRAVVAWQNDAVCDDGYYYLWVAKMWEVGRTQTALQYLNINIYPLILWGLTSLGLEPCTAGKLWGLVISGLTVLPLFALVRRIVNDRVATAAAVLFAIHPELIEVSVEPIREPTFWFCFLLATWLIYESATQWTHWIWPILAGTAMFLAIHTRTEGWALLAPLLFWPFSLGPSKRSSLRRILRIGMTLGMIPLLLVAVNLTLLRGHNQWEWGRFTPLKNFMEWVRADESQERVKVEPQETPDENAASTKPPELRTVRPSDHRKAVAAKSFPISDGLRARNPADAAPDNQTAGRSDRRKTAATQPQLARERDDSRHAAWFTYLNQFGENCEYVNLLLLLIGFLLYGRLLIDRKRLCLTIMFVGVMLAVWVRLNQIGNMNGRYFLTAYLIALPTEALGAVWLFDRLRVWAKKMTQRKWGRTAIPMTAAVLLAGFFISDAVTSGHFRRQQQADLGRALREEYGPFDVVEVDTESTRVGYFAYGSMPMVSYFDAGDGPPRPAPDVIIARRPLLPTIRQRAEAMGLVAAAPPRYHPDVTGYHIFVRPKDGRPPQKSGKQQIADRR